MTLQELRDFLNSLPEDFKGFGMVNGEVGILDGTGKEGESDHVYRCDKPIISAYVDEENKEVCLFHQTQEDVNIVYGNDDTKEVKE
jgi:hypothetical protein